MDDGGKQKITLSGSQIAGYLFLGLIGLVLFLLTFAALLGFFRH